LDTVIAGAQISAGACAIRGGCYVSPPEFDTMSISSIGLCELFKIRLELAGPNLDRTGPS